MTTDANLNPSSLRDLRPIGDTTETLSGREDHPIPNGTFTVQNSRTGDHRTFRIRTAKFGKGASAERKRVLELLIGSDNENDFESFAFVADDATRPGFVVWRRFRSADRPNVGFLNGFAPWSPILSAHQKFAEMLAVLLLRERHPFFEFLSLKLSKRCLRCNRELTDPESIERGIGPVCAEKGLG